MTLEKVNYAFTLNQPEWFKRTDFVEWLCLSSTATWHNKNSQIANEYSDAFVWVSEEGVSDPDCSIPQDIQRDIMSLVETGQLLEEGCLVWITNLDE